MSKKPFIINLTGNNGAGKDTCAEIIQEILNEHNFTCEIISLAEPVRKQCAALTNENPSVFLNEQKKKEIAPNFNITRRELLKLITEQSMCINKNIYWKIALQKIEKLDVDYVIITDCRYIEWLDFIVRKWYHFSLYNIVKDNTSTNVEYMNEEYINYLVSLSVRSTQGDIVNNGTVEELGFVINDILYKDKLI